MPEPVFCSKCRHYIEADDYGEWGDACAVAPFLESINYRSRHSKRLSPHEMNLNNDCTFYKQRPPKVMPWWKRLLWGKKED